MCGRVGCVYVIIFIPSGKSIGDSVADIVISESISSSAFLHSLFFPITLSICAQLRIKTLFLSIHKCFCTQFTYVVTAVELHRAFSSCLIHILSTVMSLENSTAYKNIFFTDD